MNLEKKYSLYREKKISGLQIRFQEIHPLIDELSPKIFKKEIIGHSENEIPIYSIRFGAGKNRIAIWTQMHGDESTATKSVFDVCNFIQSEYKTTAIQNLLSRCTFSIIPILNPDGALRYTRENAKQIDLNRDAQQLMTKEGRLLHHFVTEFKPHYAFNLHDQSSYYSVFGSDKSAVLSFLAPAADAGRTLTTSRIKAMRVIATMYKALQNGLKDQIGRYKDDFNQNCFGDSFQMSGFPTILIESGYFPDDETREITRKYHFIALMTAFMAIANNDFSDESRYFEIPMNVKNYYDCQLRNVIYDGKLTHIAFRYKYQLVDKSLKRTIDSESIITENQISNQLFHNIIDAKGRDFSYFS